MNDVQSFVNDTPWLGVPVALLAAALVALVVSGVIGRVVRGIGKRSVIAADLARRGKKPLRFTLILLAINVVLGIITEPSKWRDLALHVVQLGLIGGVAWLVGVLAFVCEDVAASRYRIDMVDNRHARRVRTQVMVLRRLTVVILTLVALAAMLMTFPSARAFGTSLLASAGVLSVVAGLAAQSSLANLFAGLQLAFTDAIRVDDVVVVEGEWGRIEEITMTYVVLHIWDDRRMILPSTYFTTNPFTNWTRHSSELLGVVEMDIDWQADLAGMRAVVTETVENTELWDGRVAILQVTDAVGSFMRVRALVSAKDGPTMFDLRCLVRERLVTYLQQENPAGLPRVRTEDAVRLDRRTAPTADTAGEENNLFSGSPEAEERASAFTAQHAAISVSDEDAARER